jgi:hypothetical protein
MNLDIYTELKKAIKDGLTEWYNENKEQLQGEHSKPESSSNILTVNQFCKKHPFITSGGIRNKLYYREYNGFDKCVSKAGRRVLIKEKEALEWFSNPPENATWTYDQKRYTSR